MERFSSALARTWSGNVDYTLLTITLNRLGRVWCPWQLCDASETYECISLSKFRLRPARGDFSPWWQLLPSANLWIDSALIQDIPRVSLIPAMWLSWTSPFALFVLPSRPPSPQHLLAQITRPNTFLPFNLDHFLRDLSLWCFSSARTGSFRGDKLLFSGSFSLQRSAFWMPVAIYASLWTQTFSSVLSEQISVC